MTAIAVVKIDETDESVREQYYLRALLDEESEAVAAVGGTNRIRGDCETTDDGVDLTMYLDGEQVGNVSDHAGFRPFKALGFFVLSSEVGTDVRFDHFEAQKP